MPREYSAPPPLLALPFVNNDVDTVAAATPCRHMAPPYAAAALPSNTELVRVTYDDPTMDMAPPHADVQARNVVDATVTTVVSAWTAPPWASELHPTNMECTSASLGMMGKHKGGGRPRGASTLQARDVAEVIAPPPVGELHSVNTDRSRRTLESRAVMAPARNPVYDES